MITNKDRALKVQRLLLLDEDKHMKDQDNTYPRVADVIADLRHFCDHFDLNWEEEMELSEIHYEDEEESEEE
tara:strand:- start:753 stop:968 length:216 start_codon:yes stop_codon:yes gene_type:complete